MKPDPNDPGRRSRDTFAQEVSRALFGVRPIPERPQEGLPAPSRRRSEVTQPPDAGYESVQGVYIISVAARLLEMHPQTLRKYERAGLVSPSRTSGALRLYSEEDIARLRLIKHLVGDLGLNVAGVQLVLQLFNHLLTVRSRLSSPEPIDLQPYIEESIGQMFELLHAHLP